MKVWVVSRASLSENDVCADVWLGVTRAKAIEAVVVGCMLDWWRDYQGAEDEENGVERASYEHIFKEYVKMFGDEEKIEVEEQEVVE